MRPHFITGDKRFTNALKPIRASVEQLATNGSEYRTVVQKATNQPQHHTEETQVSQREKQSSE